MRKETWRTSRNSSRKSLEIFPLEQVQIHLGSKSSAACAGDMGCSGRRSNPGSCFRKKVGPVPGCRQYCEQFSHCIPLPAETQTLAP